MLSEQSADSQIIPIKNRIGTNQKLMSPEYSGDVFGTGGFPEFFW
jgi:hypothetical protein